MIMSSVPRPDDKLPSARQDETIVNSGAGSVSSAPGERGFSMHADAPGVAKVISVEEFSHHLTASGLMSADELKSFCATVQPRDALQDAEAFAQILVGANRL